MQLQYEKTQAQIKKMLLYQGSKIRNWIKNTQKKQDFRPKRQENLKWENYSKLPHSSHNIQFPVIFMN